MGGGGNDDRLAHTTHVLLGISHSFVMSYHFLLPQISSCRFCKLELPEPGLTSVVARWGGGLVAVGVAAAAVVALAAVAEVAPVGSRIGAVPVAIAVAVAVGVVVVVVVVVVAAAVAVVAAPIVDIGGVVATGGGLREGTFGCLNSCSYCNIRNQYPKGPSN